ESLCRGDRFPSPRRIAAPTPAGAAVEGRPARSFPFPTCDPGDCEPMLISPSEPVARNPRMIVVFDIGNVLVRWNPRYLYRKVFDDEERMERFLSTALGMDFVSHTDVVEDFAGAIEARTKDFPEFAQELRMFHKGWIETLG